MLHIQHDREDDIYIERANDSHKYNRLRALYQLFRRANKFLIFVVFVTYPSHVLKQCSINNYRIMYFKYFNFLNNYINH